MHRSPIIVFDQKLFISLLSSAQLSLLLSSMMRALFAGLPSMVALDLLKTCSGTHLAKGQLQSRSRKLDHIIFNVTVLVKSMALKIMLLNAIMNADERL